MAPRDFCWRTNIALPRVFQLLRNAPPALDPARFGTAGLRLGENAKSGAPRVARRTTKQRLPGPSRFSSVQTEPLAQFSIFRSQLLRQLLAEPLIFLFKLDKLRELIASR